ncbi:GNAT family N-acetyltransferase [Devosia sp. XK-2]|uniref:GNAT family N-acetyltransferase n=1 Tax=Devosia sp. XK-2 TaxID=3126689 RepID=UPI0030CABF36
MTVLATTLDARLPTAIRTARLSLVVPALAHVPEMALLANNKAIHQVLSRLPHPYMESDGRFFVENIARGDSEFAWAIEQAGAFVGVIGLHLLPGRLPELGYWLGQPHWGQGFATEAGLAVVSAARAARAPGLRARALLDNNASRNVLKKLGFIEIGEDTDTTGTLTGRRVMQMRLEFDQR